MIQARNIPRYAALANGSRDCATHNQAAARLASDCCYGLLDLTIIASMGRCHLYPKGTAGILRVTTGTVAHRAPCPD